MSSDLHSEFDLGDNDIIYFAYGSNMSSRRLLARVSVARSLITVCLRGYQLRFHKHSLVDGSGKCDAFYTGQSEDAVWGVLYALPRDDLALLDDIEGSGYTRQRVTVQAQQGQFHCVYTYLAVFIDPSLKPFDWYRQHVLSGAHEFGLCEDYIRAIRAVETIEDLNETRRQREQAIYRQLK